MAPQPIVIGGVPPETLLTECVVGLLLLLLLLLRVQVALVEARVHTYIVAVVLACSPLPPLEPLEELKRVCLRRI
jgi:hypothetical protein